MCFLEDDNLCDYIVTELEGSQKRHTLMLLLIHSLVLYIVFMGCEWHLLNIISLCAYLHNKEEQQLKMHFEKHISCITHCWGSWNLNGKTWLPGLITGPSDEQ